MFGLPAEETLGDEKREVSVLDAGFLEHPVQDALHLFPDSVAVGLDDHAAAHGRLLGQIGLDYEVVIPLRVVL